MSGRSAAVTVVLALLGAMILLANHLLVDLEVHSRGPHSVATPQEATITPTTQASDGDWWELLPTPPAWPSSIPEQILTPTDSTPTAEAERPE